MEQNFFEQAEFADNPEPRCPVVLVLDTSGSMAGAAIRELNEGLRAFGSALQGDRLASLRVEVAVVAFGGKVRALDNRGNWRRARRSSPSIQRPAVRQAAGPFRRPAGVRYGRPLPTAGARSAWRYPAREAVQRSLALLRRAQASYKQNGRLLGRGYS
jgi:hypothetical protein